MLSGMKAEVPPSTRPRGRGAGENPDQRFAQLHVAYEEGEAPAKVTTKFFIDHASSVISRNSSPDVGFSTSLNPYRGCEHGCAYCYARPTHEYLGFSAGLDFESRIMVKPDAPALLRAALARPGYKPTTMALSGVTDCYQPVERKLKLTRCCLEVLAECRHPVSIVTKNHLVTRDVDLLARLAEHRCICVYVSVTSLDPKLARILEPRASAPRQRLEAIRQLHAAGVPVAVSVAPMIPAINDHEMPAIMEAAADAGAQGAFYTVVRLPFSVKDVFSGWLDQYFPERKEKVLGRIRECQGRTLSHGDFGTRMKGEGVWADQIQQVFRVSLIRSGLAHRHMPELSAAAFRRSSSGGQMELGI